MFQYHPATNDCSIEEVNAEFQKLKTAFEMPRIYMAAYFSDLIYDIDMACQVFLCGEKGEASEASVQAQEDQTIMVEAIKMSLKTSGAFKVYFCLSIS